MVQSYITNGFAAKTTANCSPVPQRGNLAKLILLRSSMFLVEHHTKNNDMAINHQPPSIDGPQRESFQKMASAVTHLIVIKQKQNIPGIIIQLNS